MTPAGTRCYRIKRSRGQRPRLQPERHRSCCARIWQSAHGSAGRRQSIASSARSIFSHSSTFRLCLQLCAHISSDEDCRSADILSVGSARILPAGTQQPGETPDCPTGKMPVLLPWNLACVRRCIFLALRARSERDQYSVCSARSTSGRAWSMAPWMVPICMPRSRHPDKNARRDAVVGPSSQQSLELSRYRSLELDSALRLCGEARCREVAAVRLAGACRGNDLCRSRAKVFESEDREWYSGRDRRRLGGGPLSRRNQFGRLDGVAVQIGVARIGCATSLPGC